MTIEEKAKAYDEALKRAKNLENTTAEEDSLIEYIFPELAESEDERIRKHIIDIVKDNAKSKSIPCDAEIAYLEKQKDINCLACDEHLKGYLAGRKVTEEEQKELPFVKDVVLGYPGLYFYDGERMHFRGNPAMEEKQKDILSERATNITTNMLEDGIKGIQRELIEFLSNTINAPWVDIIKSADAYAQRIRLMVEKQKEQKPKITDYDISLTTNDTQSKLKAVGNVYDNIHNAMEQKPVEYGDDVVEEAEEYTSKVDCGEYGVAVTEAYIAGVLSERNRKPTEWSEEDETCLEYALWCVMKTRHFVAKDDCDLDACRCAERWLELLPERFNLKPKQEWSEEDEKIAKEIEEELWYPGDFPDYPSKEESELYDDCQRRLNWFKNKLKSLRPQPHWKPSEEQMESLQTLYEYFNTSESISNRKMADNMRRLYNDLKKL